MHIELNWNELERYMYMYSVPKVIILDNLLLFLDNSVLLLGTCHARKKIRPKHTHSLSLPSDRDLLIKRHYSSSILHPFLILLSFFMLSSVSLVPISILALTPSHSRRHLPSVAPVLSNSIAVSSGHHLLYCRPP